MLGKFAERHLNLAVQVNDHVSLCFRSIPKQLFLLFDQSFLHPDDLVTQDINMSKEYFMGLYVIV